MERRDVVRTRQRDPQMRSMRGSKPVVSPEESPVRGRIKPHRPATRQQATPTPRTQRERLARKVAVSQDVESISDASLKRTHKRRIDVRSRKSRGVTSDAEAAMDAPDLPSDEDVGPVDHSLVVDDSGDGRGGRRGSRRTNRRLEIETDENEADTDPLGRLRHSTQLAALSRHPIDVSSPVRRGVKRKRDHTAAGVLSHPARRLRLQEGEEEGLVEEEEVEEESREDSSKELDSAAEAEDELDEWPSIPSSMKEASSPNEDVNKKASIEIVIKSGPLPVEKLIDNSPPLAENVPLPAPVPTTPVQGQVPSAGSFDVMQAVDEEEELPVLDLLSVKPVSRHPQLAELTPARPVPSGMRVVIKGPSPLASPVQRATDLGSGSHDMAVDDKELGKTPALSHQPTEFWAYAEPWFADITDRDLEWLNKRRTDNVEALCVIPRLGKHYLDRWSDDTIQKSTQGSPLRRIHIKLPLKKKKKKMRPASPFDFQGSGTSPSAMQLPLGATAAPGLSFAEGPPGGTNLSVGTDLSMRVCATGVGPSTAMTTTIGTERSACLGVDEAFRDTSGLAQRMVAAVIGDEEKGSAFARAAAEQGPLPNDPPQEWNVIDALVSVPTPPYPNFSLEERIRIELRSVGLVDERPPDPAAREDDPVCAKMRSYHRRLREVVARNAELKERLMKRVEPALKYQKSQRDVYLEEQRICKLFKQHEKDKKKRAVPAALQLAIMKLQEKFEARNKLVPHLPPPLPPPPVEAQQYLARLEEERKEKQRVLEAHAERLAEKITVKTSEGVGVAGFVDEGSKRGQVRSGGAAASWSGSSSAVLALGSAKSGGVGTERERKKAGLGSNGVQHGGVGVSTPAAALAAAAAAATTSAAPAGATSVYALSTPASTTSTTSKRASANTPSSSTQSQPSSSRNHHAHHSASGGSARRLGEDEKGVSGSVSGTGVVHQKKRPTSKAKASPSISGAGALSPAAAAAAATASAVSAPPSVSLSMQAVVESVSAKILASKVLDKSSPVTQSSSSPHASSSTSASGTGQRAGAASDGGRLSPSSKKKLHGAVVAQQQHAGDDARDRRIQGGQQQGSGSSRAESKNQQGRSSSSSSGSPRVPSAGAARSGGGAERGSSQTHAQQQQQKKAVGKASLKGTSERVPQPHAHVVSASSSSASPRGVAPGSTASSKASSAGGSTTTAGPSVSSAQERERSGLNSPGSAPSGPAGSKSASRAAGKASSKTSSKVASNKASSKSTGKATSASARMAAVSASSASSTGGASSGGSGNGFSGAGSSAPSSSLHARAATSAHASPSTPVAVSVGGSGNSSVTAGGGSTSTQAQSAAGTSQSAVAHVAAHVHAQAQAAAVGNPAFQQHPGPSWYYPQPHMFPQHASAPAAQEAMSSHVTTAATGNTSNSSPTGGSTPPQVLRSVPSPVAGGQAGYPYAPQVPGSQQPSGYPGPLVYAMGPPGHAAAAAAHAAAAGQVNMNSYFAAMQMAGLANQGGKLHQVQSGQPFQYQSLWTHNGRLVLAPSAGPTSPVMSTAAGHHHQPYGPPPSHHHMTSPGDASTVAGSASGVQQTAGASSVNSGGRSRPSSPASGGRIQQLPMSVVPPGAVGVSPASAGAVPGQAHVPSHGSSRSPAPQASTMSPQQQAMWLRQQQQGSGRRAGGMQSPSGHQGVPGAPGAPNVGVMNVPGQRPGSPSGTMQQRAQFTANGWPIGAPDAQGSYPNSPVRPLTPTRAGPSQTLTAQQAAAQAQLFYAMLQHPHRTQVLHSSGPPVGPLRPGQPLQFSPLVGQPQQPIGQQKPQQPQVSMLVPPIGYVPTSPKRMTPQQMQHLRPQVQQVQQQSLSPVIMKPPGTPQVTSPPGHEPMVPPPNKH